MTQPTRKRRAGVSGYMMWLIALLILLALGLLLLLAGALAGHHPPPVWACGRWPAML